MGRKPAPLPASPVLGPMKDLEAVLQFRSVTPARGDRDGADAEKMLHWYRDLAAALARGERVPAAWTAAKAADVARLVEWHCLRLELELERVDELLADRRQELDDLRALLGSKTGSEQVRARLEFLEIEQTRILAREVGAQALLSGLALGSMGARIGADPFVQRVQKRTRANRGIGDRRKAANAHQVERWITRDKALIAEGVATQTARVALIVAEDRAAGRHFTASQVRQALYRARQNPKL